MRSSGFGRVESLIGRARSALATIVVVVLIVIIALAGVAVYVFAFASPGPTPGSTSTDRVGTTTGSTTSLQGQRSYRGTFSYTQPLGPFGISGSGGTVTEWNSTQTASGSFTFSIDPTTYTGDGTGQGSIPVATHGYCTGSATVPYTFTISAVWPPGSNMTILFKLPTPSNVTVQLSCQGSTQGFNVSNNPVTFLSVYPNGPSVSAFPATFTRALSAGVAYTVTITQTS